MICKSKRSESVIIHTILNETREGVKKTRLMYNAKMSNTQLDRYLEWLLEQEIVEKKIEDGGDILYYSTEKGEKLAEMLQQIVPILNHR
jgi:predicted transcriptional regulator